MGPEDTWPEEAYTYTFKIGNVDEWFLDSLGVEGPPTYRATCNKHRMDPLNKPQYRKQIIVLTTTGMEREQ